MRRKLLASVSSLALIAVSTYVFAQGQERKEPGGGGGGSPQGEQRGGGGQQGPSGPARSQGGGTEGRSGGGGEQRAQQRGDGGGERGEQRSEPQRSEQRRERSEGQQQRRASEKAEERQQRAQQKEDSGSKERSKGEAKGKSDASERRKASEQRSEEERRNRAEQQREERKRSRAEREEQTKDRSKSAEDAQPKGQKKAGDERQQPAGKTAEPKAGAKEQQKQQQQTGQPPATPGVAEKDQQDRTRDRADRGEGRLNLTAEQRTTLRETIVRNRPERVTNIDIRIRVGERVPRRVNLYPIPDLLISTYPAYRDYRYVVIRDEICIVNPATYEIVEVIEYTSSPGQTASGSRSDRVDFTIGSNEERRIYRIISQRYQPVSLNFQLGIGVDIPDRITLSEFPTEVIEIEPRLRNYRFVYAEDQVLVVSRDSRDIVLLIRN